MQNLYFQIVCLVVAGLLGLYAIWRSTRNLQLERSEALLLQQVDQLQEKLHLNALINAELTELNNSESDW